MSYTYCRHIALATVLSFLFACPQQASARKKDKTNGKGMAAYNATEPDQLAAKARDERRMVHASAFFMPTSNARINSRYREGIDVSHYQGSINWDDSSA